MCGVIGYIGSKKTNADFFYNGLKRLEYRGYDSAGIAMLGPNNQIMIERAEGKLSNLQKKLVHLPNATHLGIGHTRWATHGKPTEQNAHPHRSHNIVLLHNGIIENYKPIKEFLLKEGYQFKSQTDTESVAHLLHYEYSKKTSHPKNLILRMQEAILAVVAQLQGTYAFGIICEDIPNALFAVKYGSPMVLGVGKNENYMSSGAAALVEHTRSMIVLEDGEIACLQADSIHIFDFNGSAIQRAPIHIDWSTSMLEKNGYDHFMLKEIYEQPQAVAQSLSVSVNRVLNQVDLASYGIKNISLQRVKRIQIIACGTSFYAGILSRYFIEKLTGIPTEVELASEYRYRTSTANQETLCVAVSQSGETIDTLQAIKYAKEHKAQTLAIVNAQGSTIAHYCHDETLIHVGPEVGVASTKALTGQVVSLILLSVGIAQTNQILPDKKSTEVLDELIKVPNLIKHALDLSPKIKVIAQNFVDLKSVLFIGRGQQWAVALEGALKLKELSYIHAEGYAGGELKHGPIALIDEQMHVVCLAPKDHYYEKMISNIEEIRARGGKIFSIGTENDKELESISDYFIGLPPVSEIALPFLTTSIVHLFSYWTACHKGCDVDQPRNLAKSVTVE